MKKQSRPSDNTDSDTLAIETTKPQILISGLARSGTTWLAKLFDSHPQVLYRHEPDKPPFFPTLPALIEPQDKRYSDPRLLSFMQGLRAQNRINVAGTLPIFKKEDEAGINFKARSLVTQITRLASQRLGNIRMLDSLRPPNESDATLVWKSVLSAGRLGYLLDTCPAMRVVFIIRNPCGVIFSRQRGVALQKMAAVTEAEFSDLINHPDQKTQQLFAKIDATNRIELEAFRWAILNSLAIKELHKREGCIVIRYEDLCAEPQQIMGQTLQSVGLPWHDQIGIFIKQSKAATSSRFYGLHRKDENVDDWRREMPKGVQSRILQIVNSSVAGEYYPIE